MKLCRFILPITTGACPPCLRCARPPRLHKCVSSLFLSSSSSQVRVLLVGTVLLQKVVDGDDPAVVEVSAAIIHTQRELLLLLHVHAHLHHLQRGVVVVTVLHRLQLLRQVKLVVAVGFAMVRRTHGQDNDHDQQSSARGQDGDERPVVRRLLGDVIKVLRDNRGFHFPRDLGRVEENFPVVVSEGDGAVSVLQVPHELLTQADQLLLLV